MMLVPTHSVILVRGGVRVTPEIGKAFDFTRDEAESLLASGIARIANGGDPNGEVVPAMTGDLAMAASKRNALTAKDVAEAAAAAAAAAVTAAQSGQPTPEAAKLAKPAKGKATKADDEDGDL